MGHWALVLSEAEVLGMGHGELGIGHWALGERIAPHSPPPNLPTPHLPTHYLVSIILKIAVCLAS